MLKGKIDFNLEKPSRLNDARHERAPSTVLKTHMGKTPYSKNRSPTFAVASSSPLLKVSPTTTTLKKLSQKVRCGYNSTSSKITEIRHIRRRRLNPKRTLRSENLSHDDTSASSEDDRSSAIPNTVKLSRSKRYKSANIPLTTDIFSVQKHKDSKLKTKYESPVRTCQKGIKIVIRRQSNQHGNNTNTMTATDLEKATTSVIVSSIRTDDNLQNKQTVTKPRNEFRQLHSVVLLKRLCNSIGYDDARKNTTSCETKADANKDEYVKFDAKKDECVRLDANNVEQVKFDANGDKGVQPAASEFVQSNTNKDNNSQDNEDEIQRGRKLDRENVLNSQYTAMRLDMELPGSNCLVKKHPIIEKKLEDEEVSSAINLSEIIGQVGDVKCMDNMPIQTLDKQILETTTNINKKGTSTVGIVKPFNHLKMSPIAKQLLEEMSLPPLLLIAEEDDSDIVRESYNIPQSSNKGMRENTTEVNAVGSSSQYNSVIASQSMMTPSQVLQSSLALKEINPHRLKDCNTISLHVNFSEDAKRLLPSSNLQSSHHYNIPVIVSNVAKKVCPRSISYNGREENILGTSSTNLPDKIHSPAIDISQAQTISTIKIPNCVSFALDLTKKKEEEQNCSGQPPDLACKSHNTINETPEIIDLSTKKTPTQPRVQNQPNQPSASSFVSRGSQHSIAKSENKQNKIYKEMINNDITDKRNPYTLNKLRKPTEQKTTEQKHGATHTTKFSIDNQQNNGPRHFSRKRVTPRDHILHEVSDKHKRMKTPEKVNSSEPALSIFGIASNQAHISQNPSKSHAHHSVSHILSKTTNSIPCCIGNKGSPPISTITHGYSGRTYLEVPSISHLLPPVPPAIRIALTVDPEPVTPMFSSSCAHVDNSVATTVVDNPDVKWTAFPSSACLNNQVTRHRSLELSLSSLKSDVHRLQPFITQQQQILKNKIQELADVKRRLSNSLHRSQQYNSNIKAPPAYVQQWTQPGAFHRTNPVQPINNAKSTPTVAILIDNTRKSSVPRFSLTNRQHLPYCSPTVPSTYGQQYKHNFVSNQTSHSSNLIQNKIPVASRGITHRTQPATFEQSRAFIAFNMKALELSLYQRSLSFLSQKMPTDRYPSNTSLQASLDSSMPNKQRPNNASKMQSKSIPVIQKMHPVLSRAPHTVINETTKAFKARVNEDIAIEYDKPNNLPTKPRQQRAYSKNVTKDARSQQSHPRLSDKQFMEAVTQSNAHQDQSFASKSVEGLCVKCKNEAYFLCSGCSKVWYCSKQCQLNDWTRHSTKCSSYDVKQMYL